MKREINELKRALCEEQREKENIINSNENLRKKIKDVETERIDTHRQLGDTKQKATGTFRLLNLLLESTVTITDGYC